MKEAMYYEREDGKIHCFLCPHHCRLKNGQTGRCQVRKVVGDKLYTLNYGKISAINVDPIEKKPIIGWMEGSRILSIGSFGCNLHCPFCQNYHISMEMPPTYQLSPDEVVKKALDLGLPSIAYTYNEPTVFYEMMLDTAKLAHKRGLKNVMVSNGFIEEEPLINVLTYLDAVNIDLKTYSDGLYKKLGGTSVDQVLKTIEIASKDCHVEISLLIVPGISDDVVEMEKLFGKLHKINKSLILHIARYYPMYKYHEDPTDLEVMEEIQRKALSYFERVNLGNVR